MVPITLYHHKLNSTLLTTVMSSKSYPKAIVVILSLENSECPWGITCLTGIQEPHNYACHTKKVCKFPMLTSNYYIISKSQKWANKRIIQWISVVFQWDSKKQGNTLCFSQHFPKSWPEGPAMPDFFSLLLLLLLPI